MEHLDQTLFLLLNASQPPSGIVMGVARVLAEGLIWVVPAGLVGAWLRGSDATRHALISAALAGLAGLMLNQAIGLLWYHPRPAEAGIGLSLIAHAPDSSFPSDHLTLIWAIAFGLVLSPATRFAGCLIAVAGIPVAWARIYLGVHYPMDMAGAILVALLCAYLVRGQDQRLSAPLLRLALPAYRSIFAGPIRCGWAKL